MCKGIRVWLTYVLLFFSLIVYWECMLQILANGSLQQLQGWFLLFALPQSVILTVFCGWNNDRISRIVAAGLTLLLGVFYCAHMVYYRIFGSMISLSMIGVGGAAIENFGWALQATLRESVGWIALFAVPVILQAIWVFLRKPAAGRIPHGMRVAASLIAGLLWLGAVALLKTGGVSDSSAYYAYSSSLVDTDTSAQKIGVLTTSEVEAGSMLFGGRGESEVNEAVGEHVELPAPPAVSPLPGVPAGSEASVKESESTEDDLSPHTLERIDFAALAKETDDETIRGLCEYFAAVPGTNRNKYTGLLKDYNLIYICAEAFSNISIAEEVTPTLYRMANEGIVLTNFYNSFKNTTTNGEFAMMTGLWPDVSRRADWGNTAGSFAQSADHYMPYGLGNLFDEQGVKSYMFHNYLGEYYARDKTHANLGYLCRFRDTMELTDLWPSSDLEMMQQTVDDYIHDERFNVYYMTFSGHGPYLRGSNVICKKNFDAVAEQIDGRRLTSKARSFMACSLELEWSMDYLLSRLEEEGKLDKTLIVIAGDHYPYYLEDDDARVILGRLPEYNFERYHSTCIMWCGGLSEPIVCDTPCCNVDILPTVLNLLGIDYDSRMLSGTDVFSDSIHMAVLSNKSFVTDVVKYNAVRGQYVCIGEGPEADPEEMSAYVENMKNEVKARYAAALAINKTDFYRFVWEKSGMLPQEG